MNKEEKYHLFQYLILLLILGGGLIGFLLMAGQKKVQFWVVVLVSILYVLWGLVHHFLEKTLYFKVVVEYIVVAILAIVILGGILL